MLPLPDYSLRSSIELELMNELRIVCEEQGKRIEYQIYNMVVSKSWGVGVFVFVESEMKSYILDPELEILDELMIDPEVVLRKGSDQSLVVEYPSHGQCTIRPIKIK